MRICCFPYIGSGVSVSLEESSEDSSPSGQYKTTYKTKIIKNEVASRRSTLPREDEPQPPEEDHAKISVQEKRAGIMGETVVARTSSIRVKRVSKNFSSKQLIRQAVMGNEFLNNLDPAQVEAIVEAMYLQKLADKSYVITEGESGSHLYVSAEGVFEVIKGGKSLGQFGPGTAFGELALLYNSKRLASIKVLKESAVWVLDRREFHTIMMRTGLQKRKEQVKFLRKVPLLSKLHEDVLNKMSDLLQVKYYEDGEAIVKQGDRGDTFYIISGGHVRITKQKPESDKEVFVTNLSVGAYFGELALLKEDRRQATVTALASGVECLILERMPFVQLLGDLKELQKGYNTSVVSEGFKPSAAREGSETSAARGRAQKTRLKNGHPHIKLKTLNGLRELAPWDLHSRRSVDGLSGWTSPTSRGLGERRAKSADIFQVTPVSTPSNSLNDVRPRSSSTSSRPQSIVKLHVYNKLHKANKRNRKKRAPMPDRRRRTVETSYSSTTDQRSPRTSSELQYDIEAERSTASPRHDGLGNISIDDERHINSPDRLSASEVVTPSHSLSFIWTSSDASPRLTPDSRLLRKGPKIPRTSIFVTEYEYIGLSDLDVVGTLGVGGFGRVELVQYKEDRSLTFALKCLKKAHVVDHNQVEHAYNEKSVMLQCKNCPFISTLYRTYRDAKYVYFLMEPCLGGDVFSVLQKNRTLDDHTAKFMTACVVEALGYLHEHGFIYRDLKPENLMLDPRGYIKMIDFGFAKSLGASGKTWTFAGTPDYVAPEIILDKGYDRAVDYWALGILVHELLTGRPPFRGSDHLKIYHQILGGINLVPFPKYVRRSASSLIKRLCRAVATERLGYQKDGVRDIKTHRWFRGFDWVALENGTMAAPIVQPVKGPTDLTNFEKCKKKKDDPPDENSGWDNDF